MLVVHAHARCLVGYHSGLPTCKWSCYQNLQDSDFNSHICGITDFRNRNLCKRTICSKQAERQPFLSKGTIFLLQLFPCSTAVIAPPISVEYNIVSGSASRVTTDSEKVTWNWGKKKTNPKPPWKTTTNQMHRIQKNLEALF